MRQIPPKAGLQPQGVLDALGTLVVTSPAARAYATAMTAGNFAPQFPLALANKDLRYVLGAADAAGAALPVVRAVQAEFQRAEDAGLGAENLTAVAKVRAV